MAPKVKAQIRVPLQAREVKIIRRLKKVLQLPETKIAPAVNRNKTTVYEALGKDWAHADGLVCKLLAMRGATW